MDRYVPEVYRRMAELYQALAEGKEVVMRDADSKAVPVTALHPNNVYLYQIEDPKPPKPRVRKVVRMQAWITPVGYRLDVRKGSPMPASGWKRLPYLDYEAVVVDPVDVVG